MEPSLCKSKLCKRARNLSPFPLIMSPEQSPSTTSPHASDSKTASKTPPSKQQESIPFFQSAQEEIQLRVSSLTEQQKLQLVAITQKRVENWLRGKLRGKNVGDQAGLPRKCLSVPPPCHKEKLTVDLGQALESYFEGGQANSSLNRLGSLGSLTSPFHLSNLSMDDSIRLSSDSVGEMAGVATLDYSDEEVFTEESPSI